MNSRFVATVTLAAIAMTASAQQKELTPDDLFRRNIGTPEMLDKQFPPHKIIDNVYYIGTESLGSFLITTSAGHILINSDYERTVPTLKKSVEQLGFKFEDIKIITGSHEHDDHMQGDALAKQLSGGAQVVALAEMLPGLQAMKPGGKEHPIDRVLHDGDKLTLGDETLIAHLTPGHTPGCTSWELMVKDAGKDYRVLINCSIGVNPNYQLAKDPAMVAQYRKSYGILRAIKVDVPLGSHPAMYRMMEKYPLIGKGVNPFIDSQGFLDEITINEKAMEGRLALQQAAAK